MNRLSPSRLEAAVCSVHGAPIAQRVTITAHPGPEVRHDTAFVLINGTTFFNAAAHTEEVNALQADLQAARAAMGASKEALLLAMEQTQLKYNLLEDFVLTLAQAVLLLKDNLQQLPDGGALVQLTKQEQEALEAALACIVTEENDHDRL